MFKLSLRYNRKTLMHWRISSSWVQCFYAWKYLGFDVWVELGKILVKVSWNQLIFVALIVETIYLRQRLSYSSQTRQWLVWFLVNLLKIILNWEFSRLSQICQTLNWGLRIQIKMTIVILLQIYLFEFVRFVRWNRFCVSYDFFLNIYHVVIGIELAFFWGDSALRLKVRMRWYRL